MRFLRQLNTPILNLLIAGAALGLIFAPYYFLPGIFALSILASYLAKSSSYRQAFWRCYIFSYGFFLVALYWISYAPAQFASFIWLVPFALLGIPAFMALLVCLFLPIAWFTKDTKYYKPAFCLLWLAYELISNWLLTGFPWALIGYSLAIAPITMQLAYYIKVYGLSLIMAIIGLCFCRYNKWWLALSISLTVFMLGFGYIRLVQNPTIYTDKTIRIVQPSIKQTDKWHPEKFWQNLDMQLALSKQGDKMPDIILWSESALTIPHYFKPVKAVLDSLVAGTDSLLITGNIVEEGEDVYPAMIVLGKEGVVDSYHKAHLVPFGEYIPFRQSYIGRVLNIKKLTHGSGDFSQGKPRLLEIKSKGLIVRPLICYEVIFPFEAARSVTKDVDLIINITNDAWYGLSAGPHQHFAISKMRAVELGLPMARAANNGISAIIDPLGRVIKSLPVNVIAIIDNLIPQKLNYQ